jgi:iron-sulfur cluster repair protein YtfE (RIC family)
MKITDALRGEHGAYYGLFQQIESLAEEVEILAQIQNATIALNAEILSHAKLEERLLIPALRPHLSHDALITAMCDEHVEMDQSLEHVEDAQTLEDAVDWIRYCVGFAREHFQKEEQILFPLADKVLGREVLEKLGQAWAEARGVALGFPESIISP